VIVGPLVTITGVSSFDEHDVNTHAPQMRMAASTQSIIFFIIVWF